MTTPLITPDLVRLGVEVDGDKHAVIAAMATLIAGTGRAERDGLLDGFEKREAQFPTGMPGGIAIPHCRTAAVSESSLALIRLDTPVDFGAKDGPADLIIAIAAGDGAGDEHMKLLAKLSRSLIKKEFLAGLRAAETQEEAAQQILAVVQPELVEGYAEPAAPAAAPAQAAAPAAAPSAPAGPVILAITSCPTGIAHTYMAAEALEAAAKEKGIELYVETQGSGGIEPFTAEQIAKASTIIIAADVGVSGRERFNGLALIESGVKRPMAEAGKMLDEAVAAANNPNARRMQADAKASSDSSADGPQVGWGKRIQQALMTGVSYMIPFVAAGGLLTALGFLFGGYDVAFVSNDVALNYSFWNLPEAQTYMQNGVELLTAQSGFRLYLGAVLASLGGFGMSFLVAALSGYIAFGLAGRPGIAPGFIGGAVSVAVGAGFIGGLITGIFAGLVAMWLANMKPPRWLAGLMPVVIIPLVTTLLVGGVMLVLLGRPLASLMTALTDGLTSMSGGSSAILLGLILGLMMCFDMGGPVNKAAYLFATAGLAAGTQASFEIMAAVMAAGMVPPLAMALSTTLRPKLYTAAERENGTTAWLLGAAFISEGAIPFAAADPARVIPSIMAGGGVTGALIMALNVGSKAPHGGIFVFFAIEPIWGFLIAVVAGAIVAGILVTMLKQMGANKKAAAAA
ncbi:PTS fructose transporter subunit IIABC [Tessaracoccus caeni]|uniref:PTS fructose transporter subunit IIABC n=1 Tax=Tessaracoccus caeni TaxID=3031239 RepID=UPI0023DCB277|nr:fructose-specific PTS transporter subunit EIIC [Tessaracoccus caeni]MDF1486796.1 fructose-specific PTS transporter subunit EIIC [Tessaracoccus caeni]